jgi:hypothetical protein
LAGPSCISGAIWSAIQEVFIGVLIAYLKP